MKKRTIFLFVLSLILLHSCTKDVTPLESKLTFQEKLIQQANDRIAEAELALQQVDVDTRSHNTVIVPAESVDALAAAIAAAGYKGKVILATGNHYESSTVMIEQTVHIKGAPGAKLIVDVGAFSNQHDPALYIRNTNKVRISNLEILPKNPPGNTGILVENGSKIRIQNNTIKDFGWIIWLAGADHAKIVDNYLSGIGNAWGLVSMAGKHVIIKGNEVTNAGSGFFLSDQKGVLFKNKSHHNAFNGFFFCTAGNTSLPDGTPINAPDAANDWLAFQNDSYENGRRGYLLMDGAYNNLLVYNESADNGIYDYHLRGDVLSSSGNLFPTSRDNLVVILNSDHIWKDCGLDNLVLGGTEVDTLVDPCP